ncbi:MAG: serpin family protein [Microcoleaceae cyanobacterium]
MIKKLVIITIGIIGCSLGIKLIISHASIAFPISQQSSEVLSQGTEIMANEMVQAQAMFGFKLFNQLTQVQENKNVFISPSSIILALSMLYNGAEGETKQEIEQALEYQGMTLEAVNQANQNLQQQLNQTTPDIQLAIANSLWLREGFSVEDKFLQNNQDFYQAEVAELDFDSPGSVKTMNQWVQDKTQGKIDRMIDRVSPNDMMFLINAIYFKGNWTEKFQESQTQNKVFYSIDGTEKQHPLMSRQDQFSYLETDDFQGISLPYGEDQRFSLYVFLPKPDQSMNNFLQALNMENWNQWMQQFSIKKGKIELPRFKLEYDIELNQVLQKLGMTSSFNPSQADFSKLSQSEDLFVSVVKHKTFLEVNEEGTEAAASTAIGMRTTSIEPNPFYMIVNRPFFCAIRDNQTGIILFMGVIYNLEN